MPGSAIQKTEHDEDLHGPSSLTGLVLYFLKLGAIGFGGPIALVGFMERDLVEKRRWLSKEEFFRGLAFAQLAPGPLAAQLAMHIGFTKNGFRGSTLVGIAFVLPSFLMVVALGVLYVGMGGLEWMQAAFYGVGAAVIGIIVKSVYTLSRITLKDSNLERILFLVVATVTAWTEQEFVLLFLLSGFVAMMFFSPPRWLLLPSMLPFPGILFEVPLFAWVSTLVTVFLFFAKAGSFVFGSGLAIIPFLYDGAVNQYHWLTEREFLDAIAIAMITPGPVVITVGFIGYLAAGLAGASAAALGVFLPPYLLVLLLAPYYEKLSRNIQVRAFVRGVTAAATGAIAGAAVVLARRAIVDVPTAAIALGALALLLRKVPEPAVIVAAALLGFALFTAGGGRY